MDNNAQRLSDLRTILTSLGQGEAIAGLDDEQLADAAEMSEHLMNEAEDIAAGTPSILNFNYQALDEKLPFATLLQCARDEIRQADIECAGGDPSLCRLIDALGYITEYLQRRFDAEMAEEAAKAAEASKYSRGVSREQYEAIQAIFGPGSEAHERVNGKTIKYPDEPITEEMRQQAIAFINSTKRMQSKTEQQS